MLTYHRTSIFESQAQTVVNTVNTVGIMGKGIAAAMKKRHPDMFKAYKRLCDQRLFDIGMLWLWYAPDQWILNFPTKRHWRNPSKLEYISSGLDKFVSRYEEKGIREIAFPRLGCGNGGLDWAQVQPLMHAKLAELPIRVYIHYFSVDMTLPEHKEYAPDYIENSLHNFIRDLSHALELNGQTLASPNGVQFHSGVEYRDDEYVLHLKIPEGDFYVDEFELSELWAQLAKGPVDKSRVVGVASEHFEYLLTSVATLSYIRVVATSRSGNGSKPSLEVERTKFSLQTVAA